MKKVFSIFVIGLVILFQVSQAEAVDYYVGNDKNGDTVYLMTETISKKDFEPSEEMKAGQWVFAYDMKFKSVSRKNKVTFFDSTIYYGFEALGLYEDTEGNFQCMNHSGKVNPRYNDDKNIYRAEIMSKAFKYLFDNNYLN